MPPPGASLPFGKQFGRFVLLTEIASLGTNAVLPSGFAVLLIRNQYGLPFTSAPLSVKQSAVTCLARSQASA